MEPAMSPPVPEPVGFITIEDEPPDLILAFVVDLGEPGEVASLILLRTPAYEPLIPPEDRGVSVSHELYPEIEDERLRRIRIGHDRVEITTTERRRFVLDVSRVDPEDLKDARELLQRMNFDRAFELDLYA
jgi:hypothetical protein